MKRSDKEKVIGLFTPLFVLSPFLMDIVGVRWFIAIDCLVFLSLLLWYSYGPIDTTTHN